MHIHFHAISPIIYQQHMHHIAPKFLLHDVQRVKKNACLTFLSNIVINGIASLVSMFITFIHVAPIFNLKVKYEMGKGG